MNRAMTATTTPWLGDIPTEWGVERCKYNFSYHKDVAKDRASDYERLALTMKGVIKRSKDDLDGLQPKDFEGYQIVNKGDLVFKLIDLAGVSTSRVGLSAYDGLVSPAYILMHADESKISKEYATYFFLSMWHRLIFNEIGNGGIRSSLNSGDLLEVPITKPPLSEQHAIVRFLDAKCSAIDEAIERHKKIIEKLEEYRTKVVSHAVMHGLNSGVEEKRYPVIGLCPSHWKVSRLKFSASVVRGGSPRPIENYITDKNGLNWIKIGDATGNGKYINSTKQQIIPEGLSKTRLVHPGTLLLTNSMSFGHPYVLNIDGCIHDGWLAFSDYDGIEQDYLYYYLMSDSAMNQFVRTVEGSVVNNLNIEKVKNSLITIPPIGEQKEIVAYLDKQNAIIDDAVRTKEAIVTKLEEYRKSIIYNAVTGKIDCREATK